MRSATGRRVLAVHWLALLGAVGVLVAAAPDYEAARHAMVAALREEGIRNAKVLAAMEKIPRHRFVAEAYRAKAYADTEITVGNGEVLNTPHLVALMTQTLDPRPETKVLEIGTGAGYQTAVLAELSSHVYTVERGAETAQAASDRLKSLGYRGIQFGVGEEAKGWPAHAPYDAILVTCAGEQIPDALVSQLADDGCLVMAIGRGPEQTLDRMRKVGGRLRVEAVIPVRVSASLTRPRGR